MREYAVAPIHTDARFAQSPVQHYRSSIDRGDEDAILAAVTSERFGGAGPDAGRGAGDRCFEGTWPADVQASASGRGRDGRVHRRAMERGVARQDAAISSGEVGARLYIRLFSVGLCGFFPQHPLSRHLRPHRMFFHHWRHTMNIHIEVLRAVPGIRELLVKDGWRLEEGEEAGLRASLRVQDQDDARQRLLLLGLLTSARIRVGIEPAW